MKSVQVCTRGEGESEIGDFTAYVLYGCPHTFTYMEKHACKFSIFQVLKKDDPRKN